MSLFSLESRNRHHVDHAGRLRAASCGPRPPSGPRGVEGCGASGRFARARSWGRDRGCCRRGRLGDRKPVGVFRTRSQVDWSGKVAGVVGVLPGGPEPDREHRQHLRRRDRLRGAPPQPWGHRRAALGLAGECGWRPAAGRSVTGRLLLVRWGRRGRCAWEPQPRLFRRRFGRRESGDGSGVNEQPRSTEVQARAARGSGLGARGEKLTCLGRVDRAPRGCCWCYRLLTRRRRLIWAGLMSGSG